MLASVASLFCGLSLSLIAGHLLKQSVSRDGVPLVTPMAIEPPLREEQIAPPADPLPHAEPISDPPVVTAPEPMQPASPAILGEAPAAAWQINAVPAKLGKVMVAVIIDDMGLDRKRSSRIVALPPPLTISFMTYASHLDEQAAQARARGHELMMHMPMQPLASSMDAGPDVLSDGLDANELRRRIDRDLDRFNGYVGVNNHMGSRFTANRDGMRVVMEELHKRGLLFIDSMTTGKSVGLALAHEADVPTAARNVFLDDVDDQTVIEAQLTQVEAQARRTGMAIAIGHPRDKTIAALEAWLPECAKRGITLVPVTTIIRHQMTLEQAAGSR